MIHSSTAEGGRESDRERERGRHRTREREIASEREIGIESKREREESGGGSTPDLIHSSTAGRSRGDMWNPASRTTKWPTEGSSAASIGQNANANRPYLQPASRVSTMINSTTSNAGGATSTKPSTGHQHYPQHWDLRACANHLRRDPLFLPLIA